MTDQTKIDELLTKDKLIRDELVRSLAHVDMLRNELNANRDAIDSAVSEAVKTGISDEQLVMLATNRALDDNFQVKAELTRRVHSLGDSFTDYGVKAGNQSIHVYSNTDELSLHWTIYDERSVQDVSFIVSALMEFSQRFNPNPKNGFIEVVLYDRRYSANNIKYATRLFFTPNGGEAVSADCYEKEVVLHGSLADVVKGIAEGGHFLTYSPQRRSMGFALN